jgi:WD40 repeat protein
MTTGSVDRTLKTWDLRTGRLQKTHTGHQDVIHTVACSVNGAFLTSGSDDGTARVFQV